MMRCICQHLSASHVLTPPPVLLCHLHLTTPGDEVVDFPPCERSAFHVGLINVVGRSFPSASRTQPPTFVSFIIIIIIIIMSSHALSLAALLSLCVCLTVGKAVTELLLEVTSVSGEDCSLLCTAEAKAGVQYRALKWYKVEETPVSRVSGLLTRDLPDGPTRWFTSLDREVELRDSGRSIFLPNVTCSDSGVYICHLAAPVGEQNREGRVLLTLTDCADSSTEELLTDTYLVIFASAVLMLALLIFLISYACLKNITKERSKTTKKQFLLNAPLKPLEKKNLKLIYTLGPKTSTMEHVCV
ncbi:CD83 antigen isoform X2 [Channa argus]